MVDEAKIPFSFTRATFSQYGYAGGNCRSVCVCGFGLAVAACFVGLGVQEACAATNVDFGIYSNGTPVSANNPYGGVLNIQAQAGWYIPPDPFGQGETSYWAEVSINNGAVEALAPFSLTNAMPTYRAWMSNSFLRPVTDVSFTAYCWRFSTYNYQGYDSNGVRFSGSGILWGRLDTGSTGWTTTVFSVPLGGYLSEFDLHNGDPLRYNAAFWVDNIAFTVIPEPATEVVAVLGAGALMFLGRGFGLRRFGPPGDSAPSQFTRALPSGCSRAGRKFG